MDWLTFWDHIVGHLVWPSVVVVGLLSQHRAVGGLIKSISEFKLKVGNNEASVGTRALEDVTKTIDVAAKVVAEKVPDEMPALRPSEPPQKRVKDEPAEDAPGRLIEPPAGEKLVLQARKRLRFRDAAAHSTPAVVIERAWQEVRTVVYAFLGINRTANDWFDLDGLPDEQLIAKLKADPRVDAELLKAIVELKMIRNDAVTTIGWQPTTNEGRWYSDNAERVIELLVLAGAKKKPE